MSDRKELSFSDFRARIGDLRGKDYWRSLEELSRSEVFDDFFADEFPQQALPMTKNGVDRRDFMKLMGASVAMAGLTACRPPAEQIIPYVKQPENLIPGKPLFFASAFPLGGIAHGVLVESHMGRPTKIEGNPDHPSSLGATDSFTQASILGLYDPDRSAVVRKYGEISTWSDFVANLQPIIAAAKANPGAIRFLTQTITSPTLGAQMQRFLSQYPGAQWHQWDAVNRDNAREGSKLAFGAYVNPVYHFDRANVVVSLGSDFLGEGPGHLRYARDFMSRRKVRHGQTTSMNRLYVIEGGMTQTGSVADHRLPVRPSNIEGYARAIAAGLGLAAQGAAAENGSFVSALVRDLQANRGNAIVIAGDDQPAEVHAIAFAINQALGSIGSAITVTESLEPMPVNQAASLRTLVADMNAGKVQWLFVLGGNPVFDAPADFNFLDAYKKVPFRTHLSLYYDETSMESHWHIPETHYLESWGDARAHDGTVSIIQPLIDPLYNGRSAHEVIGAVSGTESPSYDAVRRNWFAQGMTEDTWRKALHDGVIANSAMPARGGAASTAVPAPVQRTVSGFDLELRHDPTVYDGRFANNGWLQELPKPQTKITWDNVLIVGPKTADKLGFKADERDVLVNQRSTRIAKVSFHGRDIELPIWVVPGHAEDTATAYFGYGRRQAGKIANNTGVNVYPVRFSDALHGGSGAQISMTARPVYPIACTQEHQAIDPKIVGERGIVRSASFAEYLKNPNFASSEHHGADAEGHDEESESMYPPFDYSKGHAWGMVIDTTVCTGCNGCVIACQAENNIAIVGKEEVVREREMHWLRIDRYFSGNPEAPEVFNQPVPCMQCENAPCEPVCPVEATSHSQEGLNDMTYNRCVGTRYCSNNCPYKVRRFNFFHYADYDTPALKPMRNPHVTIRTRGVMEKCTYCVQRINEARIEAEKQDRRVKDGEWVTACAQACPTEAIVVGDLNDPNSRIAKLQPEPTRYALLEELNTRPRTTYLATLRNPNPEIKAE